MNKLLVPLFAVSVLFLSACGSESEVAVRDGDCETSAEIQSRMLAAVNAWRAKDVVCGGQLYTATHALSWNSLLTNAAQAHADDMASHDYFSHTGLDGSTPATRIEAAGYNWRAYSENIYAHTLGTVESAVQGWVESTEHCKALMSPEYNELGGACSHDSGSTYKFYYVQEFGSQ